MSAKTEEARLAEIADPATLCARLRGRYDIPVNDGLGLLNGRPIFTRTMATPPIQRAAADRIETLEAALRVVLDLDNAAVPVWNRAGMMRAAAQAALNKPPPRAVVAGWLARHPDTSPYDVCFVQDEDAAWARLSAACCLGVEELRSAGWNIQAVSVPA